MLIQYRDCWTEGNYKDAPICIHIPLYLRPQCFKSREKFPTFCVYPTSARHLCKIIDTLHSNRHKKGKLKVTFCNVSFPTLKKPRCNAMTKPEKLWRNEQLFKCRVQQHLRVRILVQSLTIEKQKRGKAQYATISPSWRTSNQRHGNNPWKHHDEITRRLAGFALTHLSSCNPWNANT